MGVGTSGGSIVSGEPGFPSRDRFPGPLGNSGFITISCLYNRQIYSYNYYMRRKPDSLLSIEISILEAGLELRTRGTPGFHGFMIAKEIKDRESARLLTAHGTLYKALGRMEKAGLLESIWEDPLTAAEEGRPRRRTYTVTAGGEVALAKAQAESKQSPCVEGGLVLA